MKQTFSWNGGSLTIEGTDEDVAMIVLLKDRGQPFPLGAVPYFLEEALALDIPAESRSPPEEIRPLTLTFATEPHTEASILAHRMRTAGIRVDGETMEDVLRAIDGLPLLSYETPVELIGRALGVPAGTTLEQLFEHLYTRADVAQLVGLPETATRAEIVARSAVLVAAAETEEPAVEDVGAVTVP